MRAVGLPTIYARPEARAAVMAAIGICYTLLAVLELWRGRGDGAWRWPIMPNGSAPPSKPLPTQGESTPLVRLSV
jgi:hypothetical protein